MYSETNLTTRPKNNEDLCLQIYRSDTKFPPRKKIPLIYLVGSLKTPIIPSNNDLSRVMGNCISISIGITYGMTLSSVDCGNFKKEMTNISYLRLMLN